MRFLVDMPLSVKTAAFLSELGHDARHLRDLKMQQAPDSAVVDKARQENRTVLTMDLGFGHLLAHAGRRFPSILLLRLTDTNPDYVNSRLNAALAVIESELENGAIAVITDSSIRVQRLPIEPQTKD